MPKKSNILITFRAKSKTQKNMKKIISLLALFVCSTFCLISCSSDDDGGSGGSENSGYLIIDDTKWIISPYFGASYSSKDNWELNFNAHLDEQGGDNRSRYLTFGVEGVKYWKDLTTGVIHATGVKFYPVNDISGAKRYSVTEGVIKVVDKSSTSTTLSFDNVVITYNNTTHKINGTIVYSDSSSK